MTREQLIGSWLERAEVFKRYDAHVDGARVLTECVRELETLFREEELDALTLDEAAAFTGYSRDHLSRLIRAGQLTNVGRKHRPRLRRGELPRKPLPLRLADDPAIVLQASKRQIARSVVDTGDGRHDG